MKVRLAISFALCGLLALPVLAGPVSKADFAFEYAAALDLGVAERSAARVNRLLDGQVAHACRVDVTEPRQLLAILREVDAFVSAVPYWLNPQITTAAIRAKRP